MANTWQLRLRGLLGKMALKSDQGIWLQPCCAIHTIGMSYPISVHFLDKNYQIVRSLPCVNPMRFAVCWRASSVIEMQSVSPDQLDQQIEAIKRFLKSGISSSA